jgi:hypothetical protein
MNADELRQLLAEALQSGSQGSTPTAGATFDETIRNFEVFGRSLKQNGSVLNTVNKLIAGQSTGWTSVKDTLKDLDKQIEDTTKQSEKQELIEKRKQIAGQLYVNNTTAAAVNFGRTITRTAGQIGSGVAGAIADLTKNLQGSGNDFRLFGNIFSTGLGTAGNVIQGLSGGIQSFGQFLTKFGPMGLIAGTGLNVLGAAAGAATGALVKLGGFVVEVLVAELEKTQKAFFGVSQAGAIFADGMTGLRTAANNGTLTIDQFANVVTKHSRDIAQAGLGVTQGAMRISGALATGGTTMRRELFNLGFSFEEQGGLVAETMRMIAASGDPLRVSNTVLAKQTQDYATNVRMLAAYTGEDLRKKAEEARKQERTLIFQAKLAEMDADQRTNFLTKFRVLDEQSRQNVMDQMAFGGQVVNQQGAGLMAMSEAYARQQRAIFQALNNSQVQGVAGMESVIAGHKDNVRRDFLNNRAIAVAQAANVGGIAGALGDIMSSQLEYLAPRNAEALRTAEENVRKAQATQENLTNALFNMTNTVQNLRLVLEQFLTENMQTFAKGLNEVLPYITEELKNLHDKMAVSGGLLNWLKGEGEKAGAGLREGAVDTAGTLGLFGGAAYGASAGFTLGTIFPGIGNVVGTILGGLLGALVGGFGGRALADVMLPGANLGKPGTPSLPPGRAVGGPVAPFKTYLVGERGPELLAMGSMGGQVIPNTSLTSGAESINSQEVKMILQELLRETKFSVDQMSKQIDKLEDIRNYNQQMLSNSY